jgi:Fe-Mn family superoxide dismutase
MHTLMKLPYQYSDLEPFIDAKTVEIHYSKHHQTYVNKLNEALAGTDYAQRDLADLLKNVESLPENLKTPVINNGGQVYNHNLYWESMSPNSKAQPEGILAEKINQKWGSFDNFKSEFSNLGATQFGSGWVWLSVDQNKELVLEKTSNADSPIMHAKTPIMTMDVWEHAYYLKYQNLRPDYIKAFWSVVNWSEIESKFLQAVA